jgi:hypothetical protein
VAKEEEPAYNSTKAVTAFVARQGLYGRFKKAKDAKNYSSAHMAEILGKKDAKEKESATSITTETEFKSDIFVKTSNVSMRDYFANKIKTSSKKVTKFQTASGGGFSLDFQADYYDQMMDKSIHGKKGLGFSRHNNSNKELKGSGSRINLTNEDSHTTSPYATSSQGSKVDHNEEEPERRGLGLGFQTGTTATATTASDQTSDVIAIPTQTSSSEIIVDSNKSKKKKKSKKDKSKEEVKVIESTSSSVVPELEKPKKQKKKKKSKTDSIVSAGDTTVTSTPVLIEDSQESSKKKEKEKKKKKKKTIKYYS